MDQKLKEMLENGITVENKQAKEAVVNPEVTTYNTVRDIRELDFAQQLGGPPRYIDFIGNQNFNLGYKTQGDPNKEKRYPRIILANVPFEVRDEGWIEVTLTPVAYPFSFTYYASR